MKSHFGLILRWAKNVCCKFYSNPGIYLGYYKIDYLVKFPYVNVMLVHKEVKVFEGFMKQESSFGDHE